ncbi:hypothetical protein BD560DRAFT_336595, partial [Blakeslea trispora]
MRISVASLIVLAAACASTVSASPISRDNSIASVNIEQPILNTPLLEKRTFTCPCEANDSLIGKIMGSLRTDLDARIFTPVSVTFSQGIIGSLDFHSIFGGSVDLNLASLKSIEAAAIANLKSSFGASLNTQINSRIYSKLEASLRKKCSGKTLNDSQLQAILAEIHSEAKTLIHHELPKIGSSLHTKAKKSANCTLKKIKSKV